MRNPAPQQHLKPVYPLNLIEIDWSDGNEIRREWLREKGEEVRNAS
jgi:hypothetical protein